MDNTTKKMDTTTERPLPRLRFRDIWTIVLTVLAGGTLSSAPLMGQGTNAIDPYRFAVASGSQTITDSGNLRARWTAESGVEASAGVAAVNNDPVLNWVSTHGSKTLTQATIGNQPLFRASSQNGRPGVEFISSDSLSLGVQLMEVDTGNNFHSIYVVGTSDNSTANAFVSESLSTSDEKYFMASVRATGAARLTMRNSAAAENTDTSTTIAANIAAVFTYILGDGTSTNFNHLARLNGGGDGTLLNNATSPATNNFSFGRLTRTSGHINFLEGFIYEVRVYGVEHDATTRDTIENELKTWWGT